MTVANCLCGGLDSTVKDDEKFLQTQCTKLKKTAENDNFY